MHEAHVGRADLGERRRADGDEDRVRSAPGRLEARCEREPSRGLVGEDQLAQARLIDRDATFAQTIDFGLVNLDTNHLMAEIGETSPRDKPDIAGADHHDAHQADPRPIAAGIAPPRHTWRRNTRTDSLRTPISRTWRLAVRPVAIRSSRS